MDKSITGVLTQVLEEGFELSDNADKHHIFTPDAHVAHRIFTA